MLHDSIEAFGPWVECWSGTDCPCYVFVGLCKDDPLLPAYDDHGATCGERRPLFVSWLPDGGSGLLWLVFADGSLDSEGVDDSGTLSQPGGDLRPAVPVWPGAYTVHKRGLLLRLTGGTLFSPLTFHEWRPKNCLNNEITINTPMSINPAKKCCIVSEKQGTPCAA